MKTIAVVGAGVMGTDVALTLSCYNYQVILKDTTQEAIDKAYKKMKSDFRMVQLLKPACKSLQAEEVLARINFTTSYDSFETAHMVIENVTEDWLVKKKVYHELSSVCQKGILYGVNTSCLSITKIAALTPQPEHVIGMHFMNPVPLKEIVELIRGHHTSEETISNAKAFLKTIDKIAVVANDMPGFIANRLSHLLMNEAAFLIQDQVASPRDVDLLFRKGYGHAMGPLETADLIGLDTVVHSLDVLYDSYKDPKFRCCPLLRRMVDAGLTGKKSGEGFYKYGI